LTTVKRVALEGIDEKKKGTSPIMGQLRGNWTYPPFSSGSNERFDGVGRLTRVLPPKLGAPRYALVDEQGNVKAYVSPVPGVSMQFYLGRQVGINGVRGYVAEQNAELLTAKRVTMLDSRLR
jgi:hypothetical protein